MERLTRFALVALGITLLPVQASYAAQTASMQYYAGKWSCLTGAVGRPPHKTIETYTFASGILHELYLTPPQGSMTKPYAEELLTAYDATMKHYVAVALDDGGSLTIADVQMNGNVEQWTYRGVPGRGDVVRTDDDHFTFTSYPTATARKPDFKEVCRRS